jgi:hypothetical protein
VCSGLIPADVCMQLSMLYRQLALSHLVMMCFQAHYALKKKESNLLQSVCWLSLQQLSWDGLSGQGFSGVLLGVSAYLVGCHNTVRHTRTGLSSCCLICMPTKYLTSHALGEACLRMYCVSERCCVSTASCWCYIYVCRFHHQYATYLPA